MKRLTGFTNQPKQQLTFVLADGSSVYVTLQYRPQQLGWFADFVWQDWSVSGLRVTAFPNILRQWKNLIPFGLAVSVKDNAEPLNIDDFVDGTASVYLLDSAEVASIDAAAFG